MAVQDQCRLNGGFPLDPVDGGRSIVLLYEPPTTVSDFRFETDVRLLFDANGNLLGDPFGSVYDDMTNAYYFNHRRKQQFLMYITQAKPVYGCILLFPIWEIVDQYLETIPIDIRYISVRLERLV